MKKIALILIIIILPSLCFANGKVAAIKKGQRAPFDGILFDKRAEATITAKRESAVKVCEIDKDYKLKKLKAQCDFDKRFLSIEKITTEGKHDSLMKLKNAEVKRLEKALDKATKPDYSRFWFVGGFVAGVGLSIGIFYAAAQAGK